MRHALLVLAACGAAPQPAKPPPPPPPTTISDELATAIETSDLPRALAAICRGYAEGGAPCASTLSLEYLQPTDVMSHITTGEHVVHMQPMPRPREGFAYWDNWSAILSGDAWQPRSLFRDDDDARRMANTLLVTVLAHELGHHLAQSLHCDSYGGLNELRADELSTPLVRSIGGRFGELHARMRKIADAMIAAVPEAERTIVPPSGDLRAWVAAHTDLPAQKRSYAVLHLSRQRRLLEEQALFVDVVRSLCLDGFASLVATRRLRPGGHVQTVARYPLRFADVTDPFLLPYAIDRDGHPYTVLEKTTGTGASTSIALRIQRLDAPGIGIDVPPVVTSEFFAVMEFAAASPTRFAIFDATSLDTIVVGSDGKATIERGPKVYEPRLVFDAAGNLAVVINATGQQTIGPPSGPPVLEIPSRTPQSGWGDGPFATAAGGGSPVAFDGTRAVFFDINRGAIRVAEHGTIETIAGSGRQGHADGDAAHAAFFHVRAIAILRDGRIAVLEPDYAHREMLLRIIR